MWSKRNGSVMDCHSTARGLFAVRNGVKTSQGRANGGAFSKLPHCRWDVKHNQPYN